MRTQNRISLWNNMTQMLFNHKMQMSEIDQLVNAVELLRTGKLSQRLVNHTVLAKSIVQLQQYLEQ